MVIDIIVLKEKFIASLMTRRLAKKQGTRYIEYFACLIQKMVVEDMSGTLAC